jgi:hypothetical protein
MPIPPPPYYGTVQINMKGISASQGSTSHNADFVFFFSRPLGAAIAQPNPVTMEGLFQTNIAIPITNALNARYTQSGNEVRFLDDALNATTLVPRALPGAIAGDSLPQHMTAYMLLKTAFRGKSFRGNKKFFPLSESDTTAGTADLLNVAALARWLTVANAILAGFTLAGDLWLPQIFSRINSQVKVNPTQVQVVPVVTILTNKRIGRMKKREAGSVY